MCNQKEKRRIHNLNRVAIASASAIAMCIDGVNTANCLYLVAALVWLFLPECDAVEEHILESFKSAKRMIRGKKTAVEARAVQSIEYNQLGMQGCDKVVAPSQTNQR